MTELGTLELAASTLATGTSVAFLVVLDWNPDLQSKLEHRVAMCWWATRMLVAFWLMGLLVRAARLFIWATRPFIDLWVPGTRWILDAWVEELEHYSYLRTYRAEHAG